MAIRFSDEVARTIYFGLCENGYNVSAVMRAVGGSAAAYWHWCGESLRRKNEIEHDPDVTEIEDKFYIAGFNPERPEEKMWAHEAWCHRAKRIAALQADSRARASLAPTPLRDQKGDIVWEKDASLLAIYGGESKEACEAARALGEVVLLDDSMLIDNAAAIGKLALNHDLPSIGFPAYAEADGLLGFGIDFPEIFRRAATFVDKIIKGAKPADLPFERASKFETIVNLKTAKAIGIELPTSVLLRANQVIE